MHYDPQTNMTNMKLRKRGNLLHTQESTKESAINWAARPETKAKDTFLRNLSVASILVLCAVTLRSGALPELTPATDVILTAATDHSLLDEQLGKLSFVSALFPEAVLVFGESIDDKLTLPASTGTVTHTWSQQEPYTSWATQEREVAASIAGEVAGVYHGIGDEWIVHVSNTDGLSCIYGNLEESTVQTGDTITYGQIIGYLQQGDELVLEVFKNGRSINPSTVFAVR